MNTLTSRFAALALTLLMSVTCIAGAVGPATAGSVDAVASTARFMA